MLMDLIKMVAWGLGIFTVGLFLILFIQIRNKRPQTARRQKAKTIDDNAELLNTLNFWDGVTGEPLVAYAKNKNADEWLENSLKYSVPTEERGLVLGVSGTGKTSYLVAQLVDWMQSGKSFVVTDVKPEIWAILKCNGVFERYGYEDLVINPTDPEALAYNPFDDMRDFNDIDELLYIIIPREVGNGAVFKDNARRLMKAIMYHLYEKEGSVSLVSMREYRYKSSDMKKLVEKLKDSDSKVASNLARDILDTAENDNFFASILSSFNEALDFLVNDVINDNLSRSDVSLAEKLVEPGKAVFLQFAEADKGKTYKLFGVMLSHVLRMLQLNHREREDVFIAIDEIMNSAPILDLPNRLNVMRSAKMPLFMYLQTIKGLDALYGVNEANMMLSACNFKICYRVNDVETARMFSDMAGDTEVVNTSISETPTAKQGYFDPGVSISESHSISTERVIQPEELLKIEPQQALVIYKGEMGKIPMPVYYQDLPMNVRNNFGTVSEYKALEEA